MKPRTVMTTDEMNDLLHSAGFSPDDDPELLGRLQIFTLLITQHRTQQLMAMFEESAKAELRDCADHCRSEGHGVAADMLLARADALLVNADAMLIKHLRMR